MDAKAKQQKKFETNKTNQDKKISKFHWRRFTIIITIVFLLLLGLGLGLYFGLRTVLPDLGVKKISTSDALKYADDLEEGSHMGLVFESPDSTKASYALYGIEEDANEYKDIKQQDQAQGSLGQFLLDDDHQATASNDFNSSWYVVEGKDQDESKQNVIDFLIADGYSFGRDLDAIETNDPGKSPFTGATYIGPVSSFQTSQSYKQREDYQENISIDIINKADNPKELTVTIDIVPPSSTDETTTESIFDLPVILWMEGYYDEQTNDTYAILQFFSIGNLTETDTEGDENAPDEPLTLDGYFFLNSKEAFSELGRKL